MKKNDTLRVPNHHTLSTLTTDALGKIQGGRVYCTDTDGAPTQICVPMPIILITNPQENTGFQSSGG